MVRSMSLLFSLLVICLLQSLISSCELSVCRELPRTHDLSILLQTRGGATSTRKQNTGIVSLVRAFWLTLIDPSNEEALQEDGKKRKDGKMGKASKGKGRILGKK